MPELAIGGFTPFSTCDWPGHLVAVVFARGCPWRCSYCHNVELQDAGGDMEHWTWSQILSRLQERRGLLDGVVFSGGEPTLTPGFIEAVRDVQSLGLSVGLHTAGVSPRHLETALPLVDWVALDVKAPPRLMPRVTGSPTSAKAQVDSLRLVLHGASAYELRTTWHPRWMSEEELIETADWLRSLGVERWIVQRGTPPDGAGACRPASLVQAALRQRIPGLAWR